VETRSLKFVADACAADVRRGSVKTLVKNVCTDSRQTKPGDLFFAIKGEKFDGHDFINEVAAKGAVAVVVPEKGKIPAPLPDCAVLVVKDTRAALGQLATAYRKEFDLPVIAVGGSNGKTTTKELIASALQQKLATVWSEASFNNDIGVPLTLLRLEKSHQAAVLEAGTNHPGELAPLVKMIQPKYGVLTNIGREHLEFFGDLAGVAQEEGWLAKLLPADGKLFVNGDSEWTEQIIRRTRATVVRVGLG
jgi:UDP-N-acetylmuramoyl-tripeptide--D-alanyl-D-alanine ligase